MTVGGARRILIVSASMGAGHDTVAGELARRAGELGHEAYVVDLLRLLPYGLGPALRRSYQASVRHFPWVYGSVYRAFLRPETKGRPSGLPLARLASDPLRDLVDQTHADVVIPVFHLAAQLTGHLRDQGRLRVPSAVLVVDFAVHRQWLHGGNDRYFCLTEDAAGEARRGVDVPVEVMGPVVAPEFFAPAEGAGRWRQVWDGRAPGRPPVLLSAGAWGAAPGLQETVRLLAARGPLPVVLCGRSDGLRRRVSRIPGAVALGWVTDMPGLLRAARVLVDNAAGQTAVQALAAQLPVLGYRPLPGHGADGVRRMAALGLSERALDEPGLLRSLDRLSAAGPYRTRRIAQGRALFKGDVLARVVESVSASAG